MEYLIDDKHRYAAAMLANGFHNNVETALKEAVRWEHGEFNTVVSNWDQYYLVYNKDWATSYYIKKIPLFRYRNRQAPNVHADENAGKYKW